MSNTVLITVVAKNGLFYIDCPEKIHLPCGNQIDIEAKDYYIQSDDNQQGWLIPPTHTAPVAPAVGFPAARIVLLNGDEYFGIADLGEGDTVNQLIQDACDGCCNPDASPAQGEPEVVATPAEIIPTLNAIGEGQTTQDCATGDCTYTYQDSLPADADGLKYKVQFVCEGTTVTSPDETTIAAALAYAQGNWGAYGTWSLSGNILQVTGSTCKAGVLKHILQNQTFTLDLATDGSDKFNQIRHNGFTQSLPTSYTPSGSNTAAIVTALTPYFGDGVLAVSSEVNAVITYTGTGKPNSVLLDGVVVATWA